MSPRILFISIVFYLLSYESKTYSQSYRTLKLIPNRENPQTSILSQDTSAQDLQKYNKGHYVLIEEYTAHTLPHLGLKLGSELELGLFNSMIIGTDTYSLIAGIPSIHSKVLILEHSHHKFSLGVRAAWLTLKNISKYAPAKDHFESLEAKVIRPAISWTNTLSPRLKIHTFWSVGIGDVHATLSEEGKRKFFETKHPGGDYDSGTTDSPDTIAGEQNTDETQDDSVSSSKNQERTSELSSDISRRTIELQSLFGLSTDRFQITGEFTRNDGKKVLISTRIERMQLEELKAHGISLTIAQQWIFNYFQFRLGIGVQYLTINGRDLDSEKVDEAKVNPIPEFAFYWRF
ncbi:MAG: hypothetical protein R3B45_12280 [Bdellovibrionota bacterium]